MSPRVLLVDIGSAAPELPVVTPPAPRPPSSWTPNPRPSPGLAPPTGLAVAAIADAAVLSWTRSTAPGATTVIESAPDNAGVPGIWREVDRTGAESYTLSLPGGPRWVRVRAELNGRTSVATNAVLAALRSSEDLEQSIADLVEEQLQQDQALAGEQLKRQQEDARVATEAASDAAAKVQAEAQQRADDLLNERLAWTAAVESEATTRESEFESLAQSMALVSAGSGEQFDPKRIWYFDADLESWVGNGTPTIVDGWLRPANHPNDAWVRSPGGLGVEGTSYRFIKLRIKKVGSPGWRGRLRWVTTTDGTYNSAKQAHIPEPSFDAEGRATVDWQDIPWWPATITQILIQLSAAQTETDYYLIDWVAIGRPTPGAGVALVQQVQQALQTADSNEALARETLAAQMRGTYTGTDVSQVTQGLIFSEREARSSAIGAEAQARQAIAAKVDDPETGLSKAHSRITEVGATAADANSATARRVDALDLRVGQSPDNLVKLGKFSASSGTGSWRGEATVVSATAIPDGTHALRINASAYEEANWFPVSDGDLFDGEITWYTGETTGTGFASFGLHARSKDGADSFHRFGQRPPLSGYAKQAGAGLALPAGTIRARPFVFREGVTGRIYFDGFRISRRSAAENAAGQAIDSMSLAISQQDDFIQGVADDVESVELRLDDPNTGLGSKASVVEHNQVKSRIDNTGNGRSIEQVASALVSVENALPGKADSEAFNSLNTYARETLAGQVQANASNISGVAARTGQSPDNLIKRGTFNSLDKGAWSGATNFVVASPSHPSGYRFQLGESSYESWGFFPCKDGDQFDLELDIHMGSVTAGHVVVGVHTRKADASNASFSYAVWEHNGVTELRPSQLTGWNTVRGIVTIPAGAGAVEGRPLIFALGGFGGYASINNLRLTRRTRSMQLTAAVTQQMRVDVDSVTGKVDASYTINLNANGYHSGVIAQNTGQVSSWRFLTDSFEIYNTSGAGLSWTDGTLWNARGTVSMISGPTLGDGMTFYIGPTPISPAQAKRSDAVFSVNADGAKVKGLLEGSLLDTGALSRNSTRIHTGGGRLAPFSTKGVGYSSSLTTMSRTITVSGFVSPDHLSGYHYRRFAWRKADVLLEAHVSGDSGDETLEIYAAYDGGAWELITSTTIHLGNRSAFPLLARYTTKSTAWNTVAFIARTTQGRTHALAFKVEVDNFNESPNPAGSNSGTNPGDTGGTPPSGGGGGGNDGGFRPGFPVVVP